MSGIYDVPDSVNIQSHADTELILNQILPYLKAMLAGGEQSDGTKRTFLDGLNSDSYFEYDPSEKRVTLVIETESSGKWDRS